MTVRQPFDKTNWTPRALQVFATAKVLAFPARITWVHLLLALEAGDSVATRVFQRLSFLPSVAFDRSPPPAVVPDAELFQEDFEPELRDGVPSGASAEATKMGWAYLGTDSLLLLLARRGVAGLKLPYDLVREAILAEHRNR